MTLLAVDDDETQIELIRSIVSGLDYPPIEYLSAMNVKDALVIVARSVVDLVLTDLHLPDGSGFDVLTGAKALSPAIAVVVMTAFANTNEAVSLLKGGADDYLIKPTARADIERVLIRVNERMSLQREALLPPAEGPVASPAVAGIIYRSESMATVLSMAARAANSSASVLLSGESGTGKELVAHFIHERSGRAGPFVAVSLSALPESLVESELFGHVKGSFTGANADRLGRFEEAEGGTLFLDEIGEIPLSVQVKLLRTIQFGQIERIGENRTRSLDVRIIAATNRSLAAMVKDQSFRRDLYYRLNVIEISLPPLRERKEDIRDLVDYFIARCNGLYGKTIQGITREALDLLHKRGFPGNIRELENAIERAVILCRGAFIRAGDLPSPTDAENHEYLDPLTTRLDYKTAMHDFEGRLIRGALERNEGNKSAAARDLGISERHLRSRLQRLNSPEKGEGLD